MAKIYLNKRLTPRFIACPCCAQEVAHLTGSERAVGAMSGESNGTPSPGSPPTIVTPLTTGAISGSTPDMTVPPDTVSPRSGQIRRKRRSEEHTSELQSHSDLVCRLLLEKKNIEDKQR